MDKPDDIYSKIMFYTIMIIFLLLLLPGFLLSRIFKIWPKSDILERTVLFFILSFSWNMLICLIGLISQLNISELTIFYFIGLLLLISIWLILNKFQLLISIKKIKLDNIKENFLWIIPIILAIFTIVIAGKNGAIFEQEAFFHLAIIKKALAGQPMTISNLNFIGTSILHPVYSFPLWHIFLALMAKICRTDIFQIWNAVLVPLSVFTFAIWAWLLRLVMPTKNTAAIGLSFFAIVILLFDQGYLLERLMVPNTLGLFVLIPIIFGLSLKYVFETEKATQTFIIFGSILFFTSIIHSLQFIYFGLIFFIFTLWLSIYQFKNTNLQIPARKAWTIIGYYGAAILIIALIALNLHLINWQNLNQNITSTNTFNNLFSFTKITFIIFPLLFLLTKKYPRTIFIISLFSVLPIIYFADTTFFQHILVQLFGRIFLDRLAAYVTWDFAIWGILITLILNFADYVIDKLKKWIMPISALIISILIIEIFLEQKFHLISKFYNQIFLNNTLTNFLNNYYWLLVLAIIVIVFLIYIWQIKFALDNSFLEKINHKFSIFILATILLFFFFSPAYTNFVNPQTKTDINHQKIELGDMGGQNTIDFINTKIPPKSRILATSVASDHLPLLTDNFMASYPRSAKESEINQFFWSDMNYENKLNLIHKFNVEYILITPQINHENDVLNQHPESFKNIYNQNQTTIFQVE